MRGIEGFAHARQHAREASGNITNAPSHPGFSPPSHHTNHFSVGVTFWFQFTDPIEPISRPMARVSPAGERIPTVASPWLPIARGLSSVPPDTPTHSLRELRTFKRQAFTDPATERHGAARFFSGDTNFQTKGFHKPHHGPARLRNDDGCSRAQAGGAPPP